MATHNLFTHWPVFEGAITTQMTDRHLMGLPEHFHQTQNLSLPLATWKLLAQEPAERLVERVQDPESPLAVRLAAGRLLAVTIDPRIDVLNPSMIDIAGGDVSIGLPAERLDAVMDELQGLGIDRSWIEKEIPRHAVTLKPYRIAEFPVTNLEYKAFLEDAQEPRIPENWSFGQFPAERANHPVFGVTVDDVQAYIDWLNARTQRHFRLPTEAEWEYAAAGPQNLAFPWGERFLPDHCNTAEQGLFGSSPIGAFAKGASPFGCMDMAGNVEEYVADDYAPYPGGRPVEDDLMTVVGNHRVARGGSFTRFRDLARNCRRHGKYPRDIYVMGFRLAETPAV
ncbi:SUMF1/EgtB/PvdO family nonheme iron enzyme [Pseudomonas viridiflava]|uniref:SUMF1/EgtB/PvdO family nonheme iron enzyme n=1 Tax=Pseudomonas viridiflava TaxID=33069 RepID=A0ABU7N2M0_PSEVI|nr:SUMF1/EgtB/PvdO family nonheme iron enzyme [Pseudomonas viridiflava]MBI6575413.1 SUMF1/EgtB/PvdO family nonheme iron enzyme [Pseudomonas viridiflava]MBI6610295.1 SUMF1/EgtB/PvdO family nonheme iron enzyme [Pseudomonas viridiflava]MBI6636492.1 SUMF1/EgtB/PvdO family nonheme iron enzyme [Pseudomonas viridiflava]MBI6866177.1 SUMF1/EgtB/PvdO family nonheme iron enzyme [Pseudomonas viridiflava]MEE3934672.1 SUMF1/EgtB/PvdO family nonheme iron enzyme [Pseudomonas viridiflava]